MKLNISEHTIYFKRKSVAVELKVNRCIHSKSIINYISADYRSVGRNRESRGHRSNMNEQKMSIILLLSNEVTEY